MSGGRAKQRTWGNSVGSWGSHSSVCIEKDKEEEEKESIQQSGRLSRTHQKGEEQGSRREEVPDIMVIKEAQQDAWPVLFPGFCWSLLGEQAGCQDPVSTHTGSWLAMLDPLEITLS